MLNKEFWNGKRVFITGHTGFKGSWFCLLLHSLGAEITGFSLGPPTNPNLFEVCSLNQFTNTITGDIRDRELLDNALSGANPDIVFHMAAQSLVKESYKSPVETYEVNVMGTVHLLEAVRNVAVKSKRLKAVVNITSDKCYENREWHWGYRENEILGGYDPYSNSKGCSELVTSCYRDSYFNRNHFDKHGVAIASARAGNVIGGGDWAKNRLIPDCIDALTHQRNIVIRNPEAVRPWQHVLEPLNGYLMLAERLYEKGPEFAEAWNFGPDDYDVKKVEWIVRKLMNDWGTDVTLKVHQEITLHEAQYLKLDCSKVRTRLNWHPIWNVQTALSKIVEWNKAYLEKKDMKDITLNQVREYMENR